MNLGVSWQLPWLKMIIWVTGFLRRTLVGDWCFDNLCGSHLQSQVTLKMTVVTADDHFRSRYSQYNCPRLAFNNLTLEYHNLVKFYKISFDVVLEQIKLLLWLWTLAWRTIVTADPINNLQKLREMKGKQSFSYSNHIHTFNVPKSDT